MAESSSTSLTAQRKYFMGEIHSFRGKDVNGLNASLSRLVGTSLTHCAAMEGNDAWSLTNKKSWSMDMILRLPPSTNSMGASGMDDLA